MAVSSSRPFFAKTVTLSELINININHGRQMHKQRFEKYVDGRYTRKRPQDSKMARRRGRKKVTGVPDSVNKHKLCQINKINESYVKLTFLKWIDCFTTVNKPNLSSKKPDETRDVDNVATNTRSRNESIKPSTKNCNNASSSDYEQRNERSSEVSKKASSTRSKGPKNTIVQNDQRPLRSRRCKKDVSYVEHSVKSPVRSGTDSPYSPSCSRSWSPRNGGARRKQRNPKSAADFSTARQSRQTGGRHIKKPPQDCNVDSTRGSKKINNLSKRGNEQELHLSNKIKDCYVSLNFSKLADPVRTGNKRNETLDVVNVEDKVATNTRSRNESIKPCTKNCNNASSIEYEQRTERSSEVSKKAYSTRSNGTKNTIVQNDQRPLRSRRCKKDVSYVEHSAESPLASETDSPYSDSCSPHWSPRKGGGRRKQPDKESTEDLSTVRQSRQTDKKAKLKMTTSSVEASDDGAEMFKKKSKKKLKTLLASIPENDFLTIKTPISKQGMVGPNITPRTALLATLVSATPSNLSTPSTRMTNVDGSALSHNLRRTGDEEKTMKTSLVCKALEKDLSQEILQEIPAYVPKVVRKSAKVEKSRGGSATARNNNAKNKKKVDPISKEKPKRQSKMKNKVDKENRTDCGVKEDGDNDIVQLTAGKGTKRRLKQQNQLYSALATLSQQEDDIFSARLTKKNKKLTKLLNVQADADFLDIKTPTRKGKLCNDTVTPRTALMANLCPNTPSSLVGSPIATTPSSSAENKEKDNFDVMFRLMKKPKAASKGRQNNVFKPPVRWNGKKKLPELPTHLTSSNRDQAESGSDDEYFHE